MKIEKTIIGSHHLNKHGQHMLNYFLDDARGARIRNGHYILALNKIDNAYVIIKLPDAPNWRPSIFSWLWFVNMFKGGYDDYYKVKLADYYSLKPIMWFEGDCHTHLDMCNAINKTCGHVLDVKTLITIKDEK